MTFFELTALTAALFHLILTFFVLSRNLRSNVNRVYFLWGFSLVVWNLAGFMKFQAQKQDDAAYGYFYLQILHLAVIVLPVTIFHIFFLIARISKPRLLTALYILHFCFAVSVFIDGAYIADITKSDYGYVVKGGPAFRAFLADYMSIAVVTIGMLFFRQRSLTPIHRTRLRALLVVYVALVVAGMHDMLPVLGYTHYPITGWRIQPLGNLTAIFFGIIMAYSVLQHQLLNIHISLSRLAAQFVRVLFMFLVGFSLTAVLLLLFPKDFSSTTTLVGSLTVLLVTAALTSILFPRFFGKGEEKLERRILGDHFEYQDRVRDFIHAIPSYTDADHLLNDLHSLLVKTLGVRRYQVILLDESKRVFTLHRSQPTQPNAAVPDLTLDSPVFRLFQDTRVGYFACKIAYAMPGETAQEFAARQQLKSFDPEICFPLLSGDDPFGLLLVGDKANEEPYTNQDLKLLASMTRELALILNQIRLKNQLLLAEQMELLGNLSRGIAHDLNNLLTPVWTYLQMATAGVQDREMTEDLLPDAMRNIETMRTYIRESLFFSKTKNLQLKSFPIAATLHRAAELFQASLKRKGMSVDVQAPADLVVEMDEVLLQRLVGNLISNAIDASPSGREIQIQIFRLGKTETGRDWVRLLVIDHGEGISPENLQRLSTAYFTTKDHGNDTRGFGLGLAICRKIVHLHGGNISIESELNKGTIVQVDLPDRQISQSNLAVAV